MTKSPRAATRSAVAFLEAFERDEACRKRDDALEAACLAYMDYDSDYSDADTL